MLSFLNLPTAIVRTEITGEYSGMPDQPRKKHQKFYVDILATFGK